MATYQDRMLAIMLSDQARIMARLEAESAGTDYCHSRNITGVPSERNRDHKASQDSWNRGLRGRTFGVAASLDSDGRLDRRADIHTVRVTRNGHTRIEDSRGFGRAAKTPARSSQTIKSDRVMQDRRLHSAMGSNHEGDS